MSSINLAGNLAGNSTGNSIGLRSRSSWSWRAAALTALAALAGCGFAGGDGAPQADAAPSDAVGPDAPRDAEIDAPPQEGIDFLPEAEESFGTEDWTIDAEVRLDTSNLTSSQTLPTGVTFREGTQHDGLTKVAILRVKKLTVSPAGSLLASGSRPLFILAATDVIVEGVLDVGASGGAPGPGGSSGGTGNGAGRAWTRLALTENDSGGGGGSFGSRGAAGGRASFATSDAGTMYPITNTRLIAGASGGTSCDRLAGAGGGALLIYGKNKIDLKGVITAGGGGGRGGAASCGLFGASSGAGGGSGGAIWLQTKDLKGNGVLAANGGGGGGGSTSPTDGGDGQDGKGSVDEVASGGARPAGSTTATSGGDGAVQATAASAVPDLTAGNGGGGGGGLGRIVYRAPQLPPGLRASPTAVAAPPP